MTWAHGFNESFLRIKSGQFLNFALVWEKPDIIYLNKADTSNIESYMTENGPARNFYGCRY